MVIYSAIDAQVGVHGKSRVESAKAGESILCGLQISAGRFIPRFELL